MPLQKKSGNLLNAPLRISIEKYFLNWKFTVKTDFQKLSLSPSWIFFTNREYILEQIV